MAVTSLALQLSDYRDLACAELFGGTSGYAGLDAGEKAEIDRLILRGERTFWLHPPGVDRPHVWSCLRDPGLLDLWGDIPVSAAVTVSQSSATMTASAATFYETMVGKSVVVTGEGTFTITGYTSSTVVTVTPTDTYSAKTFSIASDGTFRLPDDFESPESSTIVFADSAWQPDISLVNEKIVTGLRATQAQTGYPQVAAIRWTTSDGSAAQTQELVVWPEPDSHYQVSLPYMAQPQGMTITTNPYPRGGPEMADALLSVILAICQEAKDRQRGDRWAEAEQKCAQAAMRDRTRHHNVVMGRMLPDAGYNPAVLDVKRMLLPA